MEEIRGEIKRGLESLSPDQLDELMWKYLHFLKFGRKRRPKHKVRSVEEKVAKVFELIGKLKTQWW